MPDLQNFAVTRQLTVVTLTNVPHWNVAFTVNDSKTGAVLRDFSGANSFHFPQVFATFAAADQDDLVARWVMDMIRKKAPDLFS